MLLPYIQSSAQFVRLTCWRTKLVYYYVFRLPRALVGLNSLMSLHLATNMSYLPIDASRRSRLLCCPEFIHLTMNGRLGCLCDLVTENVYHFIIIIIFFFCLSDCVRSVLLPASSQMCVFLKIQFATSSLLAHFCGKLRHKVTDFEMRKIVRCMNWRCTYA